MPNHEYDDAKDNLALGLALRALRSRAQLTQGELAKRVGIGTPYVSQLENGHRGARWHTIQRILRTLNAGLAELAHEVERQERSLSS
jgi:transcriptional regulator with XRE-family HTH domain